MRSSARPNRPRVGRRRRSPSRRASPGGRSGSPSAVEEERLRVLEVLVQDEADVVGGESHQGSIAARGDVAGVALGWAADRRRSRRAAPRPPPSPKYTRPSAGASSPSDEMSSAGTFGTMRDTTRRTGSSRIAGVTQPPPNTTSAGSSTATMLATAVPRTRQFVDHGRGLASHRAPLEDQRRRASVVPARDVARRPIRNRGGADAALEVTALAEIHRATRGSRASCG